MAKVTLLCHTPQPELTVAAAAKLCYSCAGLDALTQTITPQQAEDFVQMLEEIGHESPIEHASFTFGIEGVSRSLLAQLTRHRIASFSVQSQRYVREDRFQFVTPPHIEADPQARALFLQSMEQACQSYQRLAALLEETHTSSLIAQGKSPQEARRAAEKQAIEDARFVLPNACATKLVVTMNARSLRNFFRLRCCRRAQWEIREVAGQMLHLVRQAAPALFAHSGPPCLSGPCPEGKMSCGQQEQVRQQYAKL